MIQPPGRGRCLGNSRERFSSLHKILLTAVVVAAVGRPHIIDSSKCKEGAIVIDAGIHYLEEGIVGDVIPSSKLKYISKVPGGVGILTSTLIMDNVYRCYLRRKNNGI